MTKEEEILDKHVIEFHEEFLNTAKIRRLKGKILDAMRECSEGGENIYSGEDTISGMPEVTYPIIAANLPHVQLMEYPDLKDVILITSPQYCSKCNPETYGTERIGVLFSGNNQCGSCGNNWK